MRISLLMLAFLIVGIGAWAGSTPDQQTQRIQSSPPDRQLCALMIRKGKESFARSRYSESKGYFRQAVSADPSSEEAWSNYDLALIYTIAEQFKNHGRIVTSTAPPIEADTIAPSEKKEEAVEPSAEHTPSPQAGSSETLSGGQTAPVPAVPEFKIIEDEGC